MRLESELVINATLHPELDRSLNAYRCRGHLVAVLPNIFALADRARDFDVRVAAAASSTRPYTLLGRAAAKS
ncbi:hypothetical protein BE11_14500 [Sorangium cellulosum]|nr:hypothetical protein BE11_14500 [Sorangium cellulosum]